MRKQPNWFGGLLLFLLLFLGVNGFANASGTSPVTAVAQSTAPSEKFRFLRKLAQEFSIDHNARWKHSVPEFGDVTTTISVALEIDSVAISVEVCGSATSEEYGAKPGASTCTR